MFRFQTVVIMAGYAVFIQIVHRPQKSQVHRIVKYELQYGNMCFDTNTIKIQPHEMATFKKTFLSGTTCLNIF